MLRTTVIFSGIATLIGPVIYTVGKLVKLYGTLSVVAATSWFGMTAGIIAAIAIPSVNTIISNSKKSAHIENARAMINAARYKVNSEFINTTSTFTLADLKEDKYIEKITDPSGDIYNETSSKVIATEVSGSFTYSVCLVGATATYYIGEATSCTKETELATYEKE
jgi:type IV pilus assembly protein PilA